VAATLRSYRKARAHESTGIHGTAAGDQQGSDDGGLPACAFACRELVRLRHGDPRGPSPATLRRPHVSPIVQRARPGQYARMRAHSVATGAGASGNHADRRGSVHRDLAHGRAQPRRRAGALRGRFRQRSSRVPDRGVSGCRGAGTAADAACPIDRLLPQATDPRARRRSARLRRGSRGARPRVLVSGLPRAAGRVRDASSHAGPARYGRLAGRGARTRARRAGAPRRQRS